MLNTKQMAQSALFIALMSISSHLKIPIGEVPITFQVLVVTLTGLLLTRTQIIYVILGYMGLGLIGLPVFASGAGISYVLSPSFGFIIGFLAFALIIHHIKNKIASIVLGYLVLYFIGLIYLNLIFEHILLRPLNFLTTISMFWLPFIPNDLLSIVLAYIVTPRLKRLVK